MMQLTLSFLRHIGCYYVTLLLNRDLVSRGESCLFSVFPDIVNDCPKIRKLPLKVFLRSFENVTPNLLPKDLAFRIILLYLP